MNNFTIRKLCILNLIQIIHFESFKVYLFTIRNLRILNLIKIILFETFEVYLFTIRNLRILNLIKIILFETFEMYLFSIRNFRMSEKSENFQHYYLVISSNFFPSLIPLPSSVYLLLSTLYSMLLFPELVLSPRIHLYQFNLMYPKEDTIRWRIYAY